VAAGSDNERGQILWSNGDVQNFTGRLVWCAGRIVAVTNQPHTALDFWRGGVWIGHEDYDGPIAQGDQQEADQLDCAVSPTMRYLTVRVGTTTRLYSFNDGDPEEIACVQNPYARATIPTDSGWLVEWDEKRITARPYNSRDGLVLLDKDEGHQFYFDAIELGDDLLLAYSYGQGQLASDYRAVETKFFASLPTTDVITRQTPSGYPYTDLPLPVELFYYYYQHANDSPGAPYATPSDVPCQACYPLSAGEIELANAADMPVIVDLTAAQTLTIKRLKAIGVRNEGTGEELGPQLKAAMPVAQAKGVPVLVYDDRPNPRVPQPWPSWCVFSVQCFYSFGQTPESFVSESEPKLKAAVAAGVTCLDVAFSAFDRNLADWPDGLLVTLQSCAGELCRRVPQIVSVSFFDGGRWGYLPTGEIVGGSYVHNLLPAHRQLKACVPDGPSRWPIPPILPPETDDMSTLHTWAGMEAEITAACICVGMNAADTHNTQLLNRDRFLGRYAPEQWPPERITHDILVKRWPTLTLSDCIDKSGQPLTVSQIYLSHFSV
jgi:hypothetical protein